MATLSEDSDSWAAGGIIRRDFRHSHDGPEEIPIKGKSKGRARKRSKGCPENGNGAHVYVWVEYFGKEWGYERTEGGSVIPKKKNSHWYDKICLGCGHRNNRRYDWGYGWRTVNDDGIEVYEVRHVETGPSWRLN